MGHLEVCRGAVGLSAPVREDADGTVKGGAALLQADGELCYNISSISEGKEES